MVGEGEGVTPFEGVAEEKSLAKFESDCFESVFNPAARFFKLGMEISPQGRGAPWFPPYDVRELDLGW